MYLGKYIKAQKRRILVYNTNAVFQLDVNFLPADSWCHCRASLIGSLPSVLNISFMSFLFHVQLSSWFLFYPASL